MARVLRSTQARDDLKRIGLYIARESGDRTIASRFLRRFGAVAEQYARQPLMGESRSELGDDIREFFVGNYVVFYQPISDGILIHTIIHAARDIPVTFRRLLGQLDEGDDSRRNEMTE